MQGTSLIAGPVLGKMDQNEVKLAVGIVTVVTLCSTGYYLLMQKDERSIQTNEFDDMPGLEIYSEPESKLDEKNVTSSEGIRILSSEDQAEVDSVKEWSQKDWSEIELPKKSEKLPPVRYSK